jgi:hypothetical protein
MQERIQIKDIRDYRRAKTASMSVYPYFYESFFLFNLYFARTKKSQVGRYLVNKILSPSAVPYAS